MKHKTQDVLARLRRSIKSCIYLDYREAMELA